MNKKGFAISIILYSMVFLLITIFYILLAIFKSRYGVLLDLRSAIIEDFNDSSVLTDKILKLCYDPGISYVKKYNAATNGPAIDTPDGSGTEDVCYYTSSNSTNLASKNGNVIFGDYCWQIVRTTSTGGVKLIYNGLKTADDKCPNDSSKRPTSLGIFSEGGVSSTNLSGSKIYGASFDIIQEYGSYRFKLKDTATYSWSNSTYQNIIGKYVCSDGSSPTGDTLSCDTLYYVGHYQSNTEASTERFYLATNENYSQIGTASFNSSSDSVSLVGYMFNETYRSTAKDFSTVEDIIRRNKISIAYYYGDKATWNSATNKYDLTYNDVTPTGTTEWSSIRKTAKGLYTCMSGELTSCETVYYVAANSSNAYMYSVPLSNNENIDTKGVTWTYGSSFTESGGNYTISSPTTKTILLKDWYSTFANYQNIYLCSDYTSSTCSELLFIYQTSNNEYAYNKSSNNFIFGYSVTYSGGNYTIDTDSNPNKYHKIWDWFKSYNTVSNSHYTCFKTNTDNCGSSVYYVYYTSSTTAYYIELKNGERVDDVLEKMLNISNSNTSTINKYNSSVKGIIDNWYEINLLPLSAYLDSYAVYCNDRTVKSVGGWSPSGGATVLNFEYSTLPTESSASLKCTNAADRFSQNNTEIAKLKYPVGLLTGPEISLMNSYYTQTGQVYWGMSPSNYNFEASVRFVNPSDYPVSYNVHSAYGIRPVIVLNHDIQVSGKGTNDKPYIVDAAPLEEEQEIVWYYEEGTDFTSTTCPINCPNVCQSQYSSNTTDSWACHTTNTSPAPTGPGQTNNGSYCWCNRTNSV